jgi:hypothetical protein
METVIDFIKEFRLSNYGWDVNDELILIGTILAGFILANGLISFLPAATAGRSRKILAFVVSSMAYGIIIFVMLQALLNKDYGKLGVTFVCVILFMRKEFRLLYEKYDELIDKLVRRKREQKLKIGLRRPGIDG